VYPDIRPSTLATASGYAIRIQETFAGERAAAVSCRSPRKQRCPPAPSRSRGIARAPRGPTRRPDAAAPTTSHHCPPGRDGGEQEMLQGRRRRKPVERRAQGRSAGRRGREPPPPWFGARQRSSTDGNEEAEPWPPPQSVESSTASPHALQGGRPHSPPPCLRARGRSSPRSQGARGPHPGSARPPRTSRCPPALPTCRGGEERAGRGAEAAPSWSRSSAGRPPRPEERNRRRELVGTCRRRSRELLAGGGPGG
jgi:hypothetical protein